MIKVKINFTTLPPNKEGKFPVQAYVTVTSDDPDEWDIVRGVFRVREEGWEEELEKDYKRWTNRFVSKKYIASEFEAEMFANEMTNKMRERFDKAIAIINEVKSNSLRNWRKEEVIE